MNEFLMSEARGWLLDCGCPPELLQGRSDEEVKAEVDKQYDGGWEEFKKNTLV